MGSAVGAKRAQVECCALIPGLPNEVALMILVMLPRALHGSLRRVCSAWRNALQPVAVSALRDSLSISETWVVLVFNNECIVFCDPLLRRFSSPIPLFPDHILFAIGSQVFTIGYLLQPSTRKCFDATSMQWQTQSDSIPLQENNQQAFSIGSRIAAIDSHVYFIAVAGNSLDDRKNAYKNAVRFNVKTKTWEALPNMHEDNLEAAVVSLQGRVLVIGGRGFGGEVKSGEIWDPRSHEWILEPELWPEQLFRHNIRPQVAVVLDTLYALKSVIYGNGADTDWELLRYVSASKLWISLGVFSFKEYRCCKAALCELIGAADKELWVILNCCIGHKRCAAQILSCVPTALPLRWQSVLITSSVEFPLGYATVKGNVHV